MGRIDCTRPTQYPGQLTYGQGAYVAPQRITLYAQPNNTPANKAHPLDVLTWSQSQDDCSVYSATQHKRIPSQRVFIQFSPGQQQAILPVLSDETDDKGQVWAEVLVDQTPNARNSSGWVPLTVSPDVTATLRWNPQNVWDVGQFIPWVDWILVHSKLSGFSPLQGVAGVDKQLHMMPTDTAKIVPTIAVRKQTVKFIKGNWLLVEAFDFDRNSPMGWVRWQDDDGHWMLFPNVTVPPKP
jgi:hypothetical protein